MGILWMLVTGLCFVTVTAIVKHVGTGVPSPEAAFIRFLVGLVFFLPMLVKVPRMGFTPRQYGLFALRGAAHSVGVICWFYAMTQIPIADVTALNYLNPVYVTVAAALLLGEPLPPRRMVAVGAALIGALIILRPGFQEIQSGHVAMLFTALFFAGSYLTAKVLSEQADAGVIVAMMTLCVTVALAPIAALVWVTPSLSEVAWLAGAAFFATVAHYTMTLAFACAPLTVTQPVTFLQLVWASILGAVVFGEAVDAFVLLGGALILGAVTFITWREARARRRVTPATHEPRAGAPSGEP